MVGTARLARSLFALVLLLGTTEARAARTFHLFLDEAQLSIPFNVLLLNIGGRRVLIDTGNGGEPGAVGQLRGTLGTLGVRPEMIDQIVISHFHADRKFAFPSDFRSFQVSPKSASHNRFG